MPQDAPSVLPCASAGATALCIAACLAMIAEARMARGLDTDGASTLGRFRWHARRLSKGLGITLSWAERRQFERLSARVAASFAALEADKV